MEMEIWSLIDRRKKDECWPWKGGKNNGYGWYKGRPAHRVMWEIVNGRRPDRKEVVRHRCHNRLCVRPEHLVLGTQLDNVHDSAMPLTGETLGRLQRIGSRIPEPKRERAHNGYVRVLVDEGTAIQIRRLAKIERLTISELVGRLMITWTEKHHPEWIERKRTKKKRSRR